MRSFRSLVVVGIDPSHFFRQAARTDSWDSLSCATWLILKPGVCARVSFWLFCCRPRRIVTETSELFTMRKLSMGEITPCQQIIASGSGALLTSLSMTPFDVVKTRMQAQQHMPAVQNRCYLFCNGLMDHVCYCSTVGSPFRPGSSPQHFTSTVDAFMKIPRSEGLPALWRGLPPTLVMAVPNTIIYYTLYDQLKELYGFSEGNTLSPALAGITGRTISISIISPLELIRTKLQSRKGYGYKELVTVIKTAVQQGGLLSLWQGLGPTLLRDVPFSAIYWYSYEYTKARSKDPGFKDYFVAGAISGMIASLLTQPFDVVKTHRQIELGELDFDPAARKKLPFTHSIIFKLNKERGWRSLYAGVTARLVKVAPACAIMISSYEYGKSFFKQYNREQRLLNSSPALASQPK